MLKLFSSTNEMASLICADCLSSSWQRCTVDSTIFLWGLLSIQHIHNGTILWGNLGYHSPPSHHRIPDYKCSIVVHWGHKSNQPDCWNQILVLLLFVGKFPVQQLMMKNMMIRKKRRKKMMTVGLKTCCCFCSFSHSLSRLLMSWRSVLM